jgi:hypothetical protein
MLWVSFFKLQTHFLMTAGRDKSVQRTHVYALATLKQV